jgi:hypothetical protein
MSMSPSEQEHAASLNVKQLYISSEIPQEKSAPIVNSSDVDIDEPCQHTNPVSALSEEACPHTNPMRTSVGSDKVKSASNINLISASSAGEEDKSLSNVICTSSVSNAEKSNHSVKEACASLGRGEEQSTSAATCQQCCDLSLLREGCSLDRDALFAHYYGACAEALACPSLWGHHPSIYRRSSRDITSANRNISCLEVVIHDETYPWVEATVDLVPSVYFDKPPPWCNIPEFLTNQGCHIVGKWASGRPMDQEVFQIGFCLSDAEMFHTMPPALRDAYKLAKIVRDEKFCPLIKDMYMIQAKEFITSYVLKTITFMLYQDLRSGKESAFQPSETINTALTVDSGEISGPSATRKTVTAMDSCPVPIGSAVTAMDSGLVLKGSAVTTMDSGEISGPSPTESAVTAMDSGEINERHMEEVCYWARRIYMKLGEAFDRRSLESIYIAGYNLLGDDKYFQYKDIAVKYAMCLEQILAPTDTILMHLLMQIVRLTHKQFRN